MTHQIKPRIRRRSRQATNTASSPHDRTRLAVLTAALLPVVLVTMWLVAPYAGSYLESAIVRIAAWSPQQITALTNLPKPDSGHEVTVTDVLAHGTTYQVVEYLASGAPHLYILAGNQRVEDYELAYSVLLSYAWRSEHSVVQGSDAANLHMMAAKLRSVDDTYRPLFAVAYAVEPVLDTIDKLRDYPISGIPQVEVGGFVLVDVQNAWDLLCIIPVDAADLCILEEPLRLYHKEALDVEQRMRLAATDLEQLATAIDLVLANQPVDGTEMKKLAQNSAASLQALARKLDGFAAQAHGIDTAVRTAADVLANRRWNAGVQTVLTQLRHFLPGFDETKLLDPLVSQLQNLDRVLVQGELSAQKSARDLREQEGVIEGILLGVDAKVQSAGAQWSAQGSFEE